VRGKIVISFTCPNCAKPSEAAEEFSGRQVPCHNCGTLLRVPFDLPCEDIPISPEAKTLTVEELRALRAEFGAAS
jgi:hypothetical protein